MGGPSSHRRGGTGAGAAALRLRSGTGPAQRGPTPRAQRLTPFVWGPGDPARSALHRRAGTAACERAQETALLARPAPPPRDGPPGGGGNAAAAAERLRQARDEPLPGPRRRAAPSPRGADVPRGRPRASFPLPPTCARAVERRLPPRNPGRPHRPFFLPRVPTRELPRGERRLGGGGDGPPPPRPSARSAVRPASTVTARPAAPRRRWRPPLPPPPLADEQLREPMGRQDRGASGGSDVRLPMRRERRRAGTARPPMASVGGPGVGGGGRLGEVGCSAVAANGEREWACPGRPWRRRRGSPCAQCRFRPAWGEAAAAAARGRGWCRGRR